MAFWWENSLRLNEEKNNENDAKALVNTLLFVCVSNVSSALGTVNSFPEKNKQNCNDSNYYNGSPLLIIMNVLG